MRRRPIFTALLLSLVIAVVLAARALPSQAPPSGRAARQTEILWDTWGVPHIFASDLPGASYALGLAVMQNHGDLVLRLYGQARGRGAEYWGPAYLDNDKYVRTMGIPTRAVQWAAAQPPAMRAALDAYVAAVNDYGRANSGRLAADVAVVLPVSVADVMAHLQRVLVFTFVSNPQAVRGQADQWDRGSNAWAIAPKRTAAGRALLLANPHLPWGDLFTWFEAQISVGTVNAYGAVLVGTPFLGIAFTEVLGWSHTNNTMDGADLYELAVAGGGYTWNGATRPFQTTTETLRVKQAGGGLSDETITIKHAIHGPVVAEKAGKALALRVVGLDQPNVVEQYWKMLTAANLAEFQAAQRALQNPFFTVMYADRDGHIMHLFGGRTPVRPPGPYNWSGIVPGTSDATLWTATHPYDDLPKVIDPPSGWLQNANDAPWTTTFPAAIDPARYPPYMAPKGMSLRAQQSARLIDEDASITFDEFDAYKHSTRMMLADRVLGDLLPAARAAGGRAAEAAAVLDMWDRSADASSRGAVLFEAWYRTWLRDGPVFAVPWNESEPRTTPMGLRDPAAAARALAAAADQVQRDHGRMDVPWGDVYRLQIGAHNLPASGGPSDLGIFRVVSFTNRRAAGGDSYVAVIEFGPTVRARSLIAYGNATQPGSPHVGDQLRLFAEKKLKPVWRIRAEIEANLARRETAVR